MDFRDVTAVLFGAAVDIRSVSLSEGRVELTVMAAAARRAIVFGEVGMLRCRMAASSTHRALLDSVGLEKLGAGEVWRLYAQASDGAELELSCNVIFCDGQEVGGIGRSWRH